MKAPSSRVTIIQFPARRGLSAYTLIELLCSIGIVVLLAGMLLPALRNGYARAQRIYCINNLHQAGLAFHSFAHAHQDKFTMQVSTNDGGSLEYLRAANTITGEYYFSYRHFVPLSNDLVVPKVLNCPADTRVAATNFAALQNENLSYFAAGNPEFGNSGSVLAGDRNVALAYGSIAYVGGYRRLMWTEELHRFKGNVLFSDGHVDQMNNIFSISNSAMASVANLHMPTIRRPPVAPATTAGGGGGYSSSGGARSNPLGIPTNLFTTTNQYGTNLTNHVDMRGLVVGSRGGGTLSGSAASGDPGAVGASPPPDRDRGLPIAAASPQDTPLTKPEAESPGTKIVYQRVINQGRAWLRDAVFLLYEIPWYLLLLVIIALFELRRRSRARQKHLARRPQIHPSSTIPGNGA
jgi:prepilin-type processing-associated H-X9-DG protein